MILAELAGYSTISFYVAQIKLNDYGLKVHRLSFEGIKVLSCYFIHARFLYEHRIRVVFFDSDTLTKRYQSR